MLKLRMEITSLTLSWDIYLFDFIHSPTTASGLSANNFMCCLKFPSISAWPRKAIPWRHRYWIAFICTTRPSRLVSCWLLTCALSCDSMLGLLWVNHISCASLCVWEDWRAWNFSKVFFQFWKHRLWRLSLPFYWTKKHCVCGSIGNISKTLFPGTTDA